MSKFQLGQVVMTAAVAAHFSLDNIARAAFMIRCLDRHRVGDWGDNLCAEDIAMNNEAIGGGARLMSFYALPEDMRHARDTQLWVVTEMDRASTTILFPSDY